MSTRRDLAWRFAVVLLMVGVAWIINETTLLEEWLGIDVPK